MDKYSSFPKELQNKALKTKGNMWGWKFKDIPLVVQTCRELGFAIWGGQIEFILPDGTCELYWLQADPKKKAFFESWNKYVKRSCSEFLQLFSKLVEETDFEKEATDSFSFLRIKKEQGIDIMDYLCFEIMHVSKENYSKPSK